MDCREARPLLSLLSLAVSGEHSAGLDEARRHLQNCPACLAAAQEESASDQLLARRMRMVPVPANYGAELRQRLTVQKPVPAAARSGIPRRRRWWPSVAATACLLLVCGPLAYLLLKPATMALAELKVAINDGRVSSEWPPALRTDRPYGWQMPQSALQVPGTAPPLCVIPFHFRPLRSAESVSGSLWIVDAARIPDAGTLSSLGTAEISYEPAGNFLVWREGGIVYLLVMQDAAALQQLHKAILHSRPMA